YIANWQPYFLNMNIIVRYLPFCFLIISILLAAFKFLKRKLFYIETLVFFCVGFLGTLWLTSIFGNEQSIASWSIISQSSLLPWSLVLLLCSAIIIWLGKWLGVAILREVGVIFII